MIDLEYLGTKELKELKSIADDLGLEYPKNIGKAKLLKLLAEDDESANGSSKPIEIEGTVVKKK